MKTPLILLTFCFFISTILFAQAEVKKEYFFAQSNGGLCSSTIVLYDDGTYWYENGCEASSHISFGTWKKKRDTINFKPADNKSFKAVNTVSSTYIHSDSVIVTVLDRSGVNISNQIYLGLRVPNVGVYAFEQDSTGTKKVAFKRKNGVIVSRTLSRIFQQPFEFPTDQANNFIIQLSISGEWIYPNSDWGGFGEFSLFKKNGQLISFTPHFYPQLIFERRIE